MKGRSRVHGVVLSTRVGDVSVISARPPYAYSDLFGGFGPQPLQYFEPYIHA